MIMIIIITIIIIIIIIKTTYIALIQTCSQRITKIGKNIHGER